MFKAVYIQLHDIFLKFLKVYLKAYFCKVTKKEAINTLSMALATHVNYQKDVTICKNYPYCVGKALEILLEILKN
jgi:hypothetical protein